MKHCYLGMLLNFALALPGILFLSSCASVYHNIEPATVVFDTQPANLYGGKVTISYRHDVLRHAGNRRYAKKERVYGISLVAVRIENYSPDTLNFPEDLLVMTGKQPINLLSMEEAGEALRQTFVEESGNSFVEFDAPLINATKDIINEATQLKANTAFAKELETHYLLPCFVAPGVTVVGLLALEVNRGTPLDFLIIK